ncbi:MAG: Txe/YoeB family addiction module toxin [Puniceicoccales bacterium]|jgi:toxin YoeB|nr:Txe/YoeB family addiction module toxin [Puniceicoccales bacterium]
MKSEVKDSFNEDLKKLSAIGNTAAQILWRRVNEVLETPRAGTGKPKQLKGYGPRVVWSRRIVGKHRLVYEIKEDCIIFLSCYGHYEDH